MAARVIVRVQADPFDAAAETAALTALSPDTGAIATFIGLCRSEEGRLAALELEHYPGMAENQISRVVDEACARWPVTAVTVIHRHGVIQPGNGVVFVATAAGHRSDAFAACEFLMDYLKTSAPFWKKEHRSDGTVGAWVEAKAADDVAAARWKNTD